MIERETFKGKLIKGIVLAVAISVAASSGILLLQHHKMEQAWASIEREAKNHYRFQHMEALDFLTGDLKESYQKAVVEACEAYDLMNLSHVYVLENTLIYDPDTNLYQWDVLCDDSKATGFVSAFKKTNETFAVERKYDGIDRKALLADMQGKASERKVTPADALGGPEVTDTELSNQTASMDRMGAGFEVKLGEIVYPPECPFTAAEKQRADFERGIKEYLAAQGVDSVEKIAFKEYATKEEERADMLFLLQETKPAAYSEIECIATSGGFTFSMNY